MELKQYSLIYGAFGIPIEAQMGLDVLTFSKLLRDAVCMELSRTPSGNQYLDDASRLSKTEPDVDALREQFSR